MNAYDVFRGGIKTMQRSARLMGAMPGSSLFCDCPELDRKLEAFRLFQCADREIRLPAGRLPIDEAVRRALTQEAFRAIWILEGVGRIEGRAAGLLAKGLMTDGPGARIPERALIPVHTGMGMAFGEKLLGMLGPKTSTAELRPVIERFVAACLANCRPGWEDPCIEPIGLLVRCLYPHLLAPASEVMEALNPGYRRLFWHGVGRALYFLPSNLLPIPGARHRMVRGAAAEGTSIDDRRQALAGMTWAVTLVNLPEPGVIRSLVPIGSEVGIQREFTNGLISALLSWRHMAPGDTRYLRPYTLPSPANETLWATWIETPAREALENLYPGLESRNRIPALYTCRTTEELRELSGAAREEQQ